MVAFYFSMIIMAFGMVERPKITFIDAPNPRPEIILKAAREVEEKKEIYDKLTQVMQPKVEFKVNFSGSFRFLPISDTHLYAPETDNKKVDEILGKLDEEKTIGAICGDFIEGLNLHIPDHPGKIIFTLGDQIWLAKERIRKYVESGKIVTLVGWFNGHEGWAYKQATIEAIKFIKDGLYLPDGSPLQAVFNGGVLKMNLANGESKFFKLFHDAGAGGSDQVNPVGSQRQAAWGYKLNSPDKIDGVIAGHQHHRAATSEEVTYNKLTGKEVSQVLLALGTSKGNDDEHADKYLVAMAKGPTSPSGGSIVINQRKQEKESGDSVWASYGYDKGEVLYEASKVWDKAEKQKITDEVLNKIVKRSGNPSVVFDSSNSRTTTKEDESKTPLYETFKWRVNDGNLPILVYLLANARYGSTTGKRDRPALKEILNQTAQDPYKFSLVMANFIDRDMAKEFDREDSLNAMAYDLKEVHDTKSLLGVMLSKVLRTDRWTKEVVEITHYWDRHERKYKSNKDVKDGIYPGDFLYRRSAIAKTPLYQNDSIMLLKMGKMEYSFYLLDHLSWSGSEFDMFRGLVQSERKSRLAFDVVAGGNMPGAGVMTTPDGVFVAPGWFSDYDSRGKANRKRVPKGGQAVILFPDKKMVIPASTFLEATDMHTALKLNAGLTPYEKKKIMEKGR